MQKIKYLIFTFIFLGIIFFLFWPLILPDNSQFKNILSSSPEADFVIIFNSGGWGDTPIEEAEDLTPIIRGIEKTLSEKGYKSIVVPYQRTEESIFAKIINSKDFFNYFQRQSNELAQNIGVFFKKKSNSGKKIIMVGLSNGASFVDETMKKIGSFQNSVFAIEIGIPFWQKKCDSKNILSLDNKNGDSLARGEVGVLFPAFLKGPIKWFLAKISGANLSFSLAFNFPEHKYFWDSPEVGTRISSFLSEKIGD